MHHLYYLSMNTSAKIKHIFLTVLLLLLVFTNVFSQSVTILPKSQKNTDTLSTKFFRMTNGAGASKVMISDNAGNGSWTERSVLTDTYWGLNETNHMYQVPVVNLGVGTLVPTYKLDVRDTSSPIVANFSGSSTSGAGIRISSGVTGSIEEIPVSKEWQIFHSGTETTNENGGSGQLHFKDHEGTRMIIRNTGRVGIGVLNPSEMLEVDGNARINGRIDIRNTGLGVFIGEGAGKNDDLTQNYNTFIGFNTGNANTTGGENVAIGAGNLEKNISGNANTAIGRLALINNIAGSDNVAIGKNAGFNSTGNNNIFIGGSAGANETGNDKLYIHNSDSSEPLIYGDFSQKNLAVNGRLLVGTQTPYDIGTKFDIVPNANMRVVVPNWGILNNTIVGLRLISPTGFAPQMRFAGSGNSFIDIGQDGFGSFVVEGGDVTRFAVTNAGKVGIGIHNPGAQLEIASSQNETLTARSSSEGGTWFALTNSSTGGKPWKFISTGDANSEDAGNLLIQDDSGTRMFFENTTGKVGVGTTTPQAKMEVIGNTNDILRVSSQSAAGTWFSMVNSTTNNIWKIVSTGTGNTEGEGNLLVRDNSGVKMIIKSNGVVGIGTDIPTRAKLVVDGSQSTNLSYGYLNSNGSTGTTSGTNAYSIFATHRIATSEVNVYSDARIKKVKGLTNNANDLSTLMNIQITDYQLIDSISKGNTNYKKVIAQQVEEVYPSAVTKMTDFIPDIYQLSSIDKGFIPLTKTTLKAGDKLKLITDEKQEVVEIMSVSANGIQVNSEKTGKVFVYGKEVNDFRAVDYEALTTLNMSATQQLLKRIEVLEKENQSINQLKQDVESLKNILLVSQKGK